jgi:hypothetical protein
VVDVDHDHLGGAPRGATGLDGAGCAVADLQERHQAGRLAAAGQGLVLAADEREVGAGAGAVLEQACFAHPQVHDAAFVDQVIGDRLDEAGVRLRVFIGRLGLDQLAGFEVDIVVALAGTVDAIGPVQAGVEPLRGVGRTALGGQHVHQLFIEGERVFFRIKVAALPAPVGPGAGQAVEHLLCGHFGRVALFLRQLGQRLGVFNRAPQPRGNRILFNLLEPRGHAGLAEIFLRQNVRRHLAPGGRNLDVLQLKDDRSVRIADLAGGLAELNPVIWPLARRGELPIYPHLVPS